MVHDDNESRLLVDSFGCLFSIASSDLELEEVEDELDESEEVVEDDCKDEEDDDDVDDDDASDDDEEVDDDEDEAGELTGNSEDFLSLPKAVFS